MKEDEKGLDTIFGALILILVCMMASSALIAMGPSSGDGSQDIWDLERKYDCILSSTLNLKCLVAGVEVDRQVSVENYAIEMLDRGPRNVLSPVNNASVGISSIIDFYCSGFECWCLRLNDSHLGSIELASRGRMDVDPGNTYVLSRSLISRDGGEASLDLIILQ
jgi:hypothetical protein